MWSRAEWTGAAAYGLNLSPTWESSRIFFISFLFLGSPRFQVASLAPVPLLYGAGFVLAASADSRPRAQQAWGSKPYLLLCIPVLLDVLILFLNLAMSFWSPVLLFYLFLLCV